MRNSTPSCTHSHGTKADHAESLHFSRGTLVRPCSKIDGMCVGGERYMVPIGSVGSLERQAEIFGELFGSNSAISMGDVG